MSMDKNQINVNIAKTPDMVNFSRGNIGEAQDSSHFGYDEISINRIALNYYNNPGKLEQAKGLKDELYFNGWDQMV